MIWAALGTLMQTSLHSGYDLIGDICPDHIDICADHCRSLFLTDRYHGSSIRCPAFGSYSEAACHSRATACPGTTIPMEERRQLNWSHCQQKRSNRSSEQIKKIALSAEQIGTSSVDKISLSGNGWMDGIDILNDAPLILRGLRPLPES